MNRTSRPVVFESIADSKGSVILTKNGPKVFEKTPSKLNIRKVTDQLLGKEAKSSNTGLKFEHTNDSVKSESVKKISKYFEQEKYSPVKYGSPLVNGNVYKVKSDTDKVNNVSTTDKLFEINNSDDARKSRISESEEITSKSNKMGEKSAVHLNQLQIDHSKSKEFSETSAEKSSNSNVNFNKKTDESEEVFAAKDRIRAFESIIKASEAKSKIIASTKSRNTRSRKLSTENIDKNRNLTLLRAKDTTSVEIESKIIQKEVNKSKKEFNEEICNNMNRLSDNVNTNNSNDTNQKVEESKNLNSNLQEVVSAVSVKSMVTEFQKEVEKDNGYVKPITSLKRDKLKGQGQYSKMNHKNFNRIEISEGVSTSNASLLETKPDRRSSKEFKGIEEENTKYKLNAVKKNITKTYELKLDEKNTLNKQTPQLKKESQTIKVLETKKNIHHNSTSETEEKNESLSNNQKSDETLPTSSIRDTIRKNRSSPEENKSNLKLLKVSGEKEETLAVNKSSNISRKKPPQNATDYREELQKKLLKVQRKGDYVVEGESVGKNGNTNNNYTHTTESELRNYDIKNKVNVNNHNDHVGVEKSNIFSYKIGKKSKEEEIEDWVSVDSVEIKSKTDNKQHLEASNYKGQHYAPKKAISYKTGMQTEKERKFSKEFVAAKDTTINDKNNAVKQNKSAEVNGDIVKSGNKGNYLEIEKFISKHIEKTMITKNKGPSRDKSIDLGSPTEADGKITYGATRIRKTSRPVIPEDFKDVNETDKINTESSATSGKDPLVPEPDYE